MSNIKVSLNVIMDASGSMAPLREDTIKGFNGFLEEQKSLPGEAYLTLCVFNTESNFVCKFKPLKEVKNLSNNDYYPMGGTALLDAIGQTIENTKSEIYSMKEEDRPSKVLFMIITDGEENSSRNYKHEVIKQMVTKAQQEEAIPWEFIFVGAQSIDAISVGNSIGVVQNNAVKYTADAVGTNHLYESMTRGVSEYRSNNFAFNANIFNKS